MDHVPVEVKIHILSYLTESDLSEVSLISRHWYQLAQDPVLWGRVVSPSNATDDDLYKLMQKRYLITHFSYNGSKITEEALSQLCVQFGAILTYLDFDSCDVLSPDLISLIVEHCPNMTYLDLSSNLFIDDVTMCQLVACRNLRTLKISNCDSVTDDGLGMLVSQVKLVRLDAGNLLYVRRPTIDVLIYNCLESLQSLVLDGANISNNDVIEVGKLKNLRRIELQFCDEFTDVGFEGLKELRLIKSLKLLRCFNLSNTCLSRILSNIKSLNSLVLGDCSELSDEGFISISDHCQNLTSLEITNWHGQGLTDVGLCAVLLKCHRLQSLILKGLKGVRTFITMIPVLRTNRLTYLHLGGCYNIPKLLLDTVAMFCPGLTIYGFCANRIIARSLTN